MQFEWDSQKSIINMEKHGVDFNTAARVFRDENRIEIYDAAHSKGEDRYITIGRVDGLLMVVWVSYTERGQDCIRLISARYADKKEEREYYNGYS